MVVDKVIIAQDSLRDFINTICPGAYSSLTKVDFKALDNLAVRPIGVYGSKAEIVRLLSFIEAIDNATLVFLISADYNELIRNPTEPTNYSHPRKEAAIRF